MTRLLMGLVLLSLAACGRTPTAPAELACHTSTARGIVRNPAGDSIAVWAIAQRVCQ